MNPTLKRYLVSSAITFVTAFLGMILIELKAGAPTDITVSIVFGFLGVAGRAGIKAVFESLVTKTESQV